MSKKSTPVIKGMRHDMTCRGHQFETGKTYTAKGEIKARENGFHACPVDDDMPPHSVFQYYAPGVSRYFEAEASGKIDRYGNKIAAASITIGVEIGMGEIMRRVAEWCAAKAKGVASNTGYCGAALNSGYYGAALNTRTCGAALNRGYYGAALNGGDYGAASNTGYYGAALNSGTCGAALSSGTLGAASNTGDYGAALNSGDYGAAFSHAWRGKVMCEGDGQALYCTEFANDGSIASVACGITGQNGIRAGVWYHCKDGALVEKY